MVLAVLDAVPVAVPLALRVDVAVLDGVVVIVSEGEGVAESVGFAVPVASVVAERRHMDDALGCADTVARSNGVCTPEG